MNKHRQPLNTSEVKPELSLCYAILERAVIDAIGSATSIDSYTKNQAINWIKTPITDYKPLWSFAWICDQLNLDARIVKTRIIEFIKVKHVKLNSAHHHTVISAVLDEIPPIGDYNFYYVENYYDDELPDKPPITQDIITADANLSCNEINPIKSNI